MVLVDLIASWITSFTPNEAIEISQERPVLFFWLYFAVNILLNSAFNSVGYGLQLPYVIFIEGGSYSSGK
jgi:hypothetical protein